MDDIHFLHGRHTAHCIATVDKHFTYYTLQFMTRGGVEVHYDDQRHLLRGSWLWPCNPGPYVRFWEWPRGSPWDHRYAAFTGPLVSRWHAAGLIFNTPEAVADDDLPPLVALFDEMLEQSAHPGRWGRLRAVNLLEQILLRRCQLRHVPSPHRRPWLDSVLDRISRARRPLDYAKLADSCGMSFTNFRRQFRQAMGCAVHEYAMQCRIASARLLLAESKLPLKQIAAQVGYSDEYYFSRHFKSEMGVSPGQYRKSIQR